MVSIIVRTAAKLAMLLSPTAVETESKRFQLRIDADSRLAAAAGGIAKFMADAAGLETSVVSRLQAAVIAACEEAFCHLSGDHPQLAVTFTRFADRIEVAFSHQGEPKPVIGLDVIAGFASPMGGSGAQNVFEGVDRVQYETHGPEAVTRLTKYFRGVSPGL